jgi:molecular chaperone DnaK (HSP70)
MAQKGDAAILATAEGRRLANTRVTDVTSHAFGIVLMDDRTKTEYNQVMIAKNTPIPHEVHDHFYTISNNQERVRFVVLQGQDRDPANCNTIGETELEFDRPKPRGYPVRVTYQYDANMVMHCYMEDEKTGRIAELHISQSGRMSDREVEAKKRLMDRVKVD